MIGSSPWWSSQAPRWHRRGWHGCQAVACAVPYGVVSVVLVCSGVGQVSGSASATTGP